MRRITVTAVLGVLLTCLAPATARADNVVVSGNVLAGGRTITLATLTPLADVLRTASATGVLAVTVTELGATGVAAWSVGAELCGPNAGFTAPDCGTHEMALATNRAAVIDGSNLSISGRAVTPTGTPGGTSAPVTGSENLSAARTIFNNTGQSTSSVYNGLYASTSTVTLTPPAGAATGAYTGYLVVTLVS